jgi:hypothetical protein
MNIRKIKRTSPLETGIAGHNVAAASRLAERSGIQWCILQKILLKILLNKATEPMWIWWYIKNGFVRLGWLAAILGYLRGLLVWAKTILTNWNTYVNHLNLFQNLRTFCFRPDAFVMCVSTFAELLRTRIFLVLPLTKLSRKQIFAFFYTFNLATSVVLVFAAATCFTLTPLHTITWGFGSC